MGKNIWNQTAVTFLRKYISPFVITAVMLVIVWHGAEETRRAQRSEGAQILESSIMRAAVSCYAIEGRYPQSLLYIEENYGVHIDNSRYNVSYDVFAGNMAPTVEVTEINGRSKSIPAFWQRTTIDTK